MTLEERARAVQSREDLVALIHAMRSDLQAHPDRWENPDLASFLEAMAGWTDDLPGFYANTGQEVETTSPWRLIADLLMASRIYE